MPLVKFLALIYAVNPFGADHQSNEHDPAYNPEAPELWLERMAMLGLTDPQPDQVLNQEKVKFALYGQWNYSFLDTANLCQFVYGRDGNCWVRVMPLNWFWLSPDGILTSRRCSASAKPA